MNINTYIDSVPVNNDGLNVVFTRDKSLDSGSFSITSSTRKEPYTRNSDVTMSIDDGTTLIEYVDFILESDKVTPINKSQTKFRHDITFIERTKLLEGQIVDGRTFIQPQTGTKNTLYDFFLDINQTVPLELTDKVDTTRRESLGTSIVALTKEAPEFFFDKSTKREVYDEFASDVKGFVRYARKQSSATTPNSYPYNVLEIVYENTRSNLVDKELDIEYFEAVEDITDYKSSNDITAYNLINDSGINAGIIYEPNQTQYSPFKTNEVDFNDTTAKIITDRNRDKFESLVLYINTTQGLEELDISDFVTTSDVFETLPYTGVTPDLYNNLYQVNSLIFDRDTNTISNLFEQVDLSAGAGANTDVRLELIIASALWRKYGNTVGRIQQDFDEITYRIAYKPKVDMRFINEKTNYRTQQEMSAILNQSGTNVSSVKVKSKTFGELQALGNGQFVSSVLTQDLSLIPTLEDYTVDGYGVSRFELSFNEKSLRIKTQYDKDYTSQNPRIEIDRKKEKFDIPSDERTRTRYEVYNEYLVASFTNDNEDTDHSLTNIGRDVFMNTFDRGITYNTPVHHSAFRSDEIDLIRNADGTYTPIFINNSLWKPIYPQGGMDSLEFNFAYNSPNIAGNQIYDVPKLLGTKPAQRAIQYTDSVGELNTFDIKYSNDYTVVDSKNLPLIETANTLIDIITPSEILLKKNGGELLNFTYELMVKYADDIIVGELALTQNNLVTDYELPQAPLTLISGSGRYEIDDRFFGKTGHTSAGSYTVTNNNINVPSIADDSWALVDNQNRLYVAVNQRKVDGTFEERRNVYFVRKRKLTVSEQSDLPPITPINFLASNPTDTTIDLTWDDISSNEAGYTIEYSLDELTWTNLVDLTAGTEFYQYTGLTQNTPYFFRLRGYNANGFSDYDFANVSTTQAQTTKPIILEVSRTTTTLTYQVLNNDEETSIVYADEFTPPTTSRGSITYLDRTAEIEVTGTAGQTITVYAQSKNGLKLDSDIVSKPFTLLNPSTTVAPNIESVSSTDTTISFRVRNQDGSTADIFADYNDTTPDRTTVTGVASNGLTGTITYTGLLDDTTYTIYAKAQASGENLSANDTFSIATQPSGSAPSTPSSCTLTETGRYSVSISWSNVADETGYFWQLSTSAIFSTITASGNVGANVLSKSVSNLSAGTTYYARVRAFNTFGNSGYVGSNSATTDPETIPNTPSNITAQSSDFDAITVQWQDNADNETGQRVQISTSIVFSSITATVIKLPNSEIHTFTGLSRFTDYYVRVRAENGVGDSSYVQTSTPTRTL